MNEMTLREAIDYLQPVADSTALAGYGAALAVAMDAMRKVEKLEATLKEYEDRCNRQSSEITRLWDWIKKQNAELERYREVEGKHGDA